ncbi:class II glutamine amidotransferase [Candidatus Woesearchaeota archaeon]|nr:class II glutamine amidotransferase [Candidatus Woesearchaeota archaeon]
MIIAIGELNFNPLIDSLILMAEDKNELHEHNKNNQGSFLHKEGWGIAYLDQDQNWIIEKSPLPIYKDSKIDQCRNINTNLAILHVRKATKGIVSLENTHPFQQQDFVFCHNGGIHEEILHSPSFQPQGNTDSEKLFYSLLTEINHHPKIEDAIKINLNKYHNYSGINLFLANKSHSYIYIKKNNLKEYFQMKLGINKNFLIISSEILPNLPETKWQILEQDDLITINNQTKEFSIENTSNSQ